MLAAQAEEQSMRLPDGEEAVRAQGRANDQRNRGGQVQQQIQLLAADSRHVDEQARRSARAADRLAAESRGPGRPDTQRA